MLTFKIQSSTTFKKKRKHLWIIVTKNSPGSDFLHYILVTSLISCSVHWASWQVNKKWLVVQSSKAVISHACVWPHLAITPIALRIICQCNDKGMNPQQLSINVSGDMANTPLGNKRRVLQPSWHIFYLEYDSGIPWSLKINTLWKFWVVQMW